MINKQTILSMAERFLPKEKINTLSKAYDFANEITNITQNPKEALERAGVCKSDIQKAKNLLNNPVANFIFGEKKQSIIEGLNRAENLFDNTEHRNFSVVEAHIDELEILQRNLSKIK